MDEYIRSKYGSNASHSRVRGITDLFNQLASQGSAWRPPTDVYEIENALVVRVEVAGMQVADFSIEIEGQYLEIRGVRQDSEEKLAYHCMEIPYGAFMIQITLPFSVEVSQIQASYQDGFLKVLLPKSQPVSIKIK